MDLLTSLYYISAPTGQEFEMVNYIDAYLTGIGVSTYRDKSNNLYATKGVSETYPCVIAHTDEVHKVKPASFAVYNINGMLIGIDDVKKEYVGIGADDKNGIWVALKCFERFDVMKAAFFVSEEIGCVGSEQADMAFFNDCRFVIQCDRRNGKDFITSISGVDLCSDLFVEDCNIEAFGYKETTGLLTDVMTLKENGLGVSCVNISCGYYNPHQDTEYTNFDELNNCLEFVCSVILNCTNVYPHEYVCKYTRSYGLGKQTKRDYGYSNYDWYDETYNNNGLPGTEYTNQYYELLEYLSDIYMDDNEEINYTVDEIYTFIGSDFPLLDYADFTSAFYDVYGTVPYQEQSN